MNHILQNRIHLARSARIPSARLCGPVLLLVVDMVSPFSAERRERDCTPDGWHPSIRYVTIRA